MKTVVAQFIGSTGDGGAERIALEYAQNLDKESFDSIIIVRRRIRGSANDELFMESGIKLYEIYKHHSLLWKILQKPFDYWYTSYSLLKIIRREKVDVLHTHLELLRFVAIIRKKIKNVRLFFTTHSEPSIIFGKGFNVERIAAKQLIKDNRLTIIALHEGMKRELLQLFREAHIEIIHNGINLKNYEGIGISKQDIRRQLGIPPNAYVVGNVGRFVHAKNHSQLIDIFVRLKSFRPDAFLLLVGSGSLKSKVIAKLNEKGCDGSYLILSHRTDVPNLLRTMDVFLFPSIYEGLGVALVEAQIAGIRCVASDRINKEAIITYGNSLLSLDDSVDDWCEAILKGKKLVEPISKAIDYDINHEIEKLECLYKR